MRVRSAIVSSCNVSVGSVEAQSYAWVTLSGVFTAVDCADEWAGRVLEGERGTGGARGADGGPAPAALSTLGGDARAREGGLGR